MPDLSAEPAAFSVTLELNEAGRARFMKTLERGQRINPSLTAEALMFSIFLYGLDKVELELAVSELPHDTQGRIVTH